MKTLLGEGVIDFPNHTAYGRYFVFAPAGGVDINVVNRWRIRAEYEYQYWPGAPGIPGLPSGAMEPNGVSVGINYRMF
jgi:opacity protein-like surface antigen